MRSKNILTLLYFTFLLCSLITACNNAAEKGEDTYPAASYDTAVTAQVDTMESQTGNVPPVTVDTAAVKTTDPGSDKDAPNAALAYAFKSKMKKGDHQLIQVHVQLSKPVKKLENDLRNGLDEQKARETGSSDTSRVKSMPITADKYLLVSIEKYDTAVFDIDSIYGKLKQELKFNSPNKWIWRVTAKKETPKSEIFIIVKSEDSSGQLYEKDLGILPIQITVGNKFGRGNGQGPSFLVRYGWLLFVVLLLLIVGFVAAAWLKKKRLKKLRSRIYFSYAWQNEKDTIIDQLYTSLKNAGYNVIRDKVNLQYQGLISSFMKDIGKGNIIVTAISDKYLKSRFCMFELYEIYRNCGMNKEAFVKKIFPIRQEEINLSDATIVNKYMDYWKTEELNLEAIVKDKDQQTTSEQFAQYEAVKRIRAELGNLLYFLSDINSLNIELLSNNDFAAVKQSLQNAINNLDKS
jgi:hypothetical protein